MEPWARWRHSSVTVSLQTVAAAGESLFSQGRPQPASRGKHLCCSHLKCHFSALQFQQYKTAFQCKQKEETCFDMCGRENYVYFFFRLDGLFHHKNCQCDTRAVLWALHASGKQKWSLRGPCSVLHLRERHSMVQPCAWHSPELLPGHPCVSLGFSAPAYFLQLPQPNAGCPMALRSTP